MTRKIQVLDTTLRDGEQSPGCSMNLKEKLKVARQLERLRVDVIEAGFPIASRDDFAAVREIASTVKECGVAGFARATMGDVTCAWDAVKVAERPRLHVFLATSDLHMKYKLQMSRDQVLETAEKAVAFARGYCSEVQFTAEDASRSDRDFLMQVFLAVEKAGATILNIADTVGYWTPEETAELTRFVRERTRPETLIGIHCHNDLGMATANTLSAVKAGADHVDVTIAGIGERAGMAALEEVVMAIKTRPGFYGAETGVNTREFFRAGKVLSKNIDVTIPSNKAVIGENAFAHEAGVHQHGMMANPLTYEIMKPEDVGVYVTRLVMGKHSGKAALAERLEQLGYSLEPEELEAVFVRFKALADRKKVISDLDVEELVRGEVKVAQRYALKSFVVNSGTLLTATAVVRLRHGEEELESVATGETAVIAAFKAVDNIVQHSYPLHHFTIHSLSEGRTELAESVVQVRNGDKVLTGRGLNTDIVEACIKAYLGAINKALAV